VRERETERGNDRAREKERERERERERDKERERDREIETMSVSVSVSVTLNVYTSTAHVENEILRDAVSAGDIRYFSFSHIHVYTPTTQVENEKSRDAVSAGEIRVTSAAAKNLAGTVHAQYGVFFFFFDTLSQCKSVHLGILVGCETINTCIEREKIRRMP